MNIATAGVCLLAAWALAACGDHGGGGLFYALAALCCASAVVMVWDEDQGQTGT
jgi:hypothetical protein